MCKTVPCHRDLNSNNSTFFPSFFQDWTFPLAPQPPRDSEGDSEEGKEEQEAEGGASEDGSILINPEDEGTKKCNGEQYGTAEIYLKEKE